MELPLLSSPCPSITVSRSSRFSVSPIKSSFPPNPHKQHQRYHLTSRALPETAASAIMAAAAVVGAATMLALRTKRSSDIKGETWSTCEDCGGSGICSECNGEGFVLKKLSEEGAEKARMAAKNMATRYTAGLPKKWTYCFKCSSARSCSTCRGTGRIMW